MGVFVNPLWINQNLLNKVNEVDPDAIIFFKGELISPKVLKILSENRDTYLLYPDTFKFKPLSRRELKYFKSVFTASNNKSLYYELDAKRVTTVPWACDPDFHKRIDVPKKNNVSFIGTAYLERMRIIKSLPEVDVFGNYWYGMGKHSHSSIYGYDYVKTINESRINLNLQAKISIYADVPTMRTFELAGC